MTKNNKLTHAHANYVETYVVRKNKKVIVRYFPSENSESFDSEKIKAVLRDFVTLLARQAARDYFEQERAQLVRSSTNPSM